MQWQPIETAPKDGTDILLYYGLIDIGHWHQYKSKKAKRTGWKTRHSSYMPGEDPAMPLTHWCPIPTPPPPRPGVWLDSA